MTTISHPSQNAGTREPVFAEGTTNSQYDKVVSGCREIFIAKAKDYGASWLILRPISVIDQILIKVKRIRSLQEKKINMVGDPIMDEFKGIINYSVIAMIQFSGGEKVLSVKETNSERLDILYKEKIEHAKKTMLNKNHDYGEAWRDMRQESFIDLIYMKLLRVEQIVENNFKAIASEGVNANFIDIINYSVFALILIQEGKHIG